MYAKKIALKNIGPIDELSIEFPFNEEGIPKPIIFVGENGTGKTILLSQIVDALFEVGKVLFQDVLPIEGLSYKYYKLSSKSNIQVGKEGFSLVSFLCQNNKTIEYFDKVGMFSSSDFKSLIPDFSLNPSGEGPQKSITDIFPQEMESLQKEFLSGAYFYQPAYRYEEPFWKNDLSKNIVTFEEKKRFRNYLNKNIEVITSAEKNKSYLLDVVLDAFRYGDSGLLFMQINEILRKIKQMNNISLGIGSRYEYRISIVELSSDGKPQKQLVPSIDNLSLGESILFNLFLNIIRHADSAASPVTDISNIQGIVIIDEIDTHLHTNLQIQVLPELIKLFKKVQFIMTTHSPFLLLGMKKVFGEDGFKIINMPTGETIAAERFHEFETAYQTFKDTEKYRREIEKQIQGVLKPILFVEGDYDVKYIEKAAELLNKKDLLDKIRVLPANGYNNLDQIWKIRKNLYETIHSKILLLYDCDTNKKDDQEADKIYKRVIPKIEDNPIKKGIENLFPEETIEKAMQYNEAFIDYTMGKKRIRGEKREIMEYEVNKDEKGNLCKWLVKNGNENDFGFFKDIFDIIENILLN